MTDRTLTATEVFARRLRDVRREAKLSRETLTKRLAAIGYKLTRQAIEEIERWAPDDADETTAKDEPVSGRRVTLDDWLAISAALDVAPIHMLVPFEREEVLTQEEMPDARIGEDFHPPVALLKVGAGMSMVPAVARAWIRGKAIHPDAPVSAWRRFYCVQVPPAVRDQLRQTAEYVRQHAKKLDKWVLPPMEVPDEERAPEVAVPGFTTPDNMRGFPAPLWTWLAEREEER